MRVAGRFFRRLCLCVAGMCLVCTVARAEGYTHSIGGNIGSVYGFSYKGLLFPKVPGLAFQTDLGIKLLAVPAGVEYMGGAITVSVPCYTFEVNPNLLYQSAITEFDEGRIDWYAGGGLSVGMMRDMGSTYNYVFRTTRGKFGVNAVAGLELQFDEAPVNLSFDFRPGYGLGFYEGYTLSFFDWAIVVGVRYRF